MGLDVYALVTERIMQSLANGVVPWHKPWSSTDTPMNLVSKREYRGVNRLLLGMAPYASRWWLTYKQATALGAQVRKGEKSSLVVFYRRFEVEDKNDPSAEPDVHYLLRYYNVFNAEQVDGLELPEEPPNDRPTEPSNARAIDLVWSMPNAPTIKTGGGHASYSPTLDVVRVPKMEDFESEAAYFCTLFHELTHSTGHASRLNRFAEDGTSFTFGSKSYAREELVAEIGAAFMLTACDLADVVEYDNSAAYIGSWLKRLEDDPRLVVVAAGRAQKAAEYVMQTAHVEEEALVANEDPAPYLEPDALRSIFDAMLEECDDNGADATTVVVVGQSSGHVIARRQRPLRPELPFVVWSWSRPSGLHSGRYDVGYVTATAELTSRIKADEPRMRNWLRDITHTHTYTIVMASGDVIPGARRLPDGGWAAGDSVYPEDAVVRAEPTAIDRGAWPKACPYYEVCEDATMGNDCPTAGIYAKGSGAFGCLVMKGGKS